MGAVSGGLCLAVEAMESKRKMGIDGPNQLTLATYIEGQTVVRLRRILWVAIAWLS